MLSIFIYLGRCQKFRLRVVENKFKFFEFFVENKSKIFIVLRVLDIKMGIRIDIQKLCIEEDIFNIGVLECY